MKVAIEHPFRRYIAIFAIIDVLFIYCPIVRGGKLNLKAFTGKSFSLFNFIIDVLFIYCPIVTIVSARYYFTYAQASAAVIYFHATKPSLIDN